MLTFEQARNLYFRFKTTNAMEENKGFRRLQRLYEYYMGRHAICEKPNRGEGYKTYRVVHNYPQYVATISTGYFMGMPVSYISEDKDALEPALDIMEDNDGQTVDYDNALDMSIYGRAFRLFYTDEKGELNFKDLDPKNVIVIDDGKVKESLTDAIYFSENLNANNNVDVRMFVYDKEQMVEYYFEAKMEWFKTSESGFNSADIEIPYKVVNEETHNITDEEGNPKLPIIKFKNNKFELGDYEPHLSLIDAYNDLVSGNMEDLSDFTDAFLKLVNMNETDMDDIKRLKEEKVLMLDENGDADWLIKQVNPEFVNSMKDRLEADIHKYTFVPNMNDANFGGNLSGVAIKYKLLALEQVRGQKERMFNKALTDQLAIIKGYLDRTKPSGKSFELKDVKLQFTPNLPPNFLEEADLVTKLRTAGLPDEYVYAKLSDVQDVEHILEMKKSQEEEMMSDGYEEVFNQERTEEVTNNPVKETGGSNERRDSDKKGSKGI
ncbi:TPA: phage portal protein [Bacillus paranthracis]